jgi:hypothetical protein
MFDKLIREVKKMEQGIRIPIDLPLDDVGYLDRRCPENSCHFEFKVLFEDWRDKVSDDKVFCPLCRHEEPATEWKTDEQAEYIQSVAVAYAQKIINTVVLQS